jgi:hypothetical protein
MHACMQARAQTCTSERSHIHWWKSELSQSWLKAVSQRVPTFFSNSSDSHTFWGSMSKTCLKLEHDGIPSQTTSQTRCPSLASMSQCRFPNTSQQHGCPQTSQTGLPKILPEVKKLKSRCSINVEFRQDIAPRRPALCSFGYIATLQCIAFCVIAYADNMCACHITYIYVHIFACDAFLNRVKTA